ncbi:MAG: hypothetical protein M3O36_08900 [Myxococcota bacterium]|nr:hypothetical protein [Myxococcota bacterium]
MRKTGRAHWAHGTIGWRSLTTWAFALAPVIALLWGATQRRWVHDDGFINLRIVRNLLHGDGPVFNIDERVEAGTSPLWIAILAVLGALGARLEPAAVFAGISLTGVGLLAAQVGCSSRSPSVQDRGWAAVGLPIGAAVVAALPPVWDYASSGLETGLALAWLGLSFAALARRIDRPREGGGGGTGWSRRDAAAASFVGLGALVRPEFILYVGAFCVALVAQARREATHHRKPAGVLASAARTVGAACALPLAYEVFRAGYYGCLAPNTAIAKEAFLTNWPQGRCYLGNFFGTYQLGWPLAAATVFWLVRLARRGTGVPRALAPTVLLPVAAALHATYLVAIGGDYMHARLLIPSLFAALLPVMNAPCSTPGRAPPPIVLASCAVALGVWAVVCATRLRVGVENVCGIGDEHGWYVARAGQDNPVTLEAYRGHPFHEGGMNTLARILGACPGSGSSSAPHPFCRRVFVEEDDMGALAPSPTAAVIATGVDSRIEAVVSTGAIGIFGYLLPRTVHLLDNHGLADPLTARVALHERDRPGHEKKLPPAWMLARFAEPMLEEDARITAARHALACGPLADLERSVAGPLTARTVFGNFTHALANSRLRIPADPFEAEATLCKTPRLREISVGGGGGTAFRWQCPLGRRLAGLRVAFRSEDAAIAFVRPTCSPSDDPTAVAGTIEGPGFGQPTSSTFDVACPEGAVLTGLRGWADHLIRSVGVVCSAGAALAPAIGVERGQEFTIVCPARSVALGSVGRSGALVDALGLACATSRSSDQAAGVR